MHTEREKKTERERERERERRGGVADTRARALEAGVLTASPYTTVFFY